MKIKKAKILFNNIDVFMFKLCKKKLKIYFTRLFYFSLVLISMPKHNTEE